MAACATRSGNCGWACCALVRPAGFVLHTTQHRLREKTFLAEHGFPVTRFARIASEADLRRVLPGFGPAILKTAGFGYDGKSQYRVNSLADAESAWDAMGRQGHMTRETLHVSLRRTLCASPDDEPVTARDAEAIARASADAGRKSGFARRAASRIREGACDWAGRLRELD